PTTSALEGTTECRASRDSSEFDAVDGSSTGTRVPRLWEQLRLPRFGGAIHANGYDNRSRYRQVGLPSSWAGWRRPGSHPPPVETTLGPGVLSEVTAVLG